MKKTYTAPRLGVYNIGEPAQPICTSMETGNAETNEVLSTGNANSPWSSSAWETSTDGEDED